MQARTTKLIDGRTIVNPASSYRAEVAKIDAVPVCSEHSVRHLAGPCDAPLFQVIGVFDTTGLLDDPHYSERWAR